MDDMLRNMIKGVKSKYMFDETVEKLKKKVEDAGWSIVSDIDFTDKVGVRFRMIEFCNKDFASAVLKRPENRWISAMMPCKLSIVENPDGVYVFSFNMAFFAEMIPGELGEILGKVAKADEEIVSAIA